DGITITVLSSVPDVFYTTDGSEPNTNSLRVQISGNTGTINWNESAKDLSYLKVKAFSGTNSSATVSGKAVDASSIGIPKDKKAGPGSTIIVPVVAVMKPGERLRSIQFIAQITPNGAAPVISDQFRLMNVTTNDFIQIAAPMLDPSKPAVLDSTSLLIGNSRSLVITAIGTNSNFEVKSYAVVAMLIVPIPSSATIGDSYTIQVTTASGTSDGLPSSSTNNIVLTPLAAKTIYITNVAYTIGDTAPSGWYEAGAFGDGRLLNNDVVNVFYASLGIKTPPPFTDLFDAMDAFPDDEPGIPGGDGDIRFMDWQRILLRSLGLLTNTPAGTNWVRYWTNGGVRTNGVAADVQIAYSPIIQHSENGDIVWRRDARIGAISVANVQPGSFVNVPVYLQTASDVLLYGLQFRASIIPDDASPPPEESPQFISVVSAQPLTTQIGNSGLACVWGGYGFGETFGSGISGSNLLGYIRFKIPASAKPGDSYTVRFMRPDSGWGNRQFNLESFPANVCVLSEVGLKTAMISDEWRTNFFGSITNRWSEPEADPDGDGVPNWMEFARGSNPVKLRLLIQRSTLQPDTGMRIRWFGKTGLRYAIEWSDNLNVWNEFNTLSGNGDMIEFGLTNSQTAFRFFRVRTK
ncbi:MAG: chitobiase/beta-hexosaminidase C-terminal domain-containing protein, partial [Limisphaerales bacterium]